MTKEDEFENDSEELQKLHQELSDLVYEKHKAWQIYLKIRPKLKAQILKENPLSGLTDEDLIQLGKIKDISCSAKDYPICETVFSKFSSELKRRKQLSENKEAKKDG